MFQVPFNVQISQKDNTILNMWNCAFYFPQPAGIIYRLKTAEYKYLCICTKIFHVLISEISLKQITL